MKHILYEKDAVDKGLPTEWDCQILHPFSDGGNGNILKLEGLDAIGNQGIVDEFESGVTSIIIPGGTIEGNSIVIPPNAPIRVDSNSGNEQGIQTNASVADNVFQDHVRHLLEGKKKVIAIRVVDSNGVKLSSSPSQISDSIFGTNGDPHNLVSRYDDCSFGKLRMEPVEELNSGDPSLNAVGVYEVRISASANNVENSVIREKVTDQLNIDWPSTRLPEDSPGRLDSTVPFDYAMYCLPPGTKGSWVRNCDALRAMDRLRSTACFTHFRTNSLPISDRLRVHQFMAECVQWYGFVVQEVFCTLSRVHDCRASLTLCTSLCFCCQASGANTCLSACMKLLTT